MVRSRPGRISQTKGMPWKHRESRSVRGERVIPLLASPGATVIRLAPLSALQGPSRSCARGKAKGGKSMTVRPGVILVTGAPGHQGGEVAGAPGPRHAVRILPHVSGSPGRPRSNPRRFPQVPRPRSVRHGEWLEHNATTSLTTPQPAPEGAVRHWPGGLDMKRSSIVGPHSHEGPAALARPSPRGDLSGSLAMRSSSLRALFPPPRATPLS